MCTVTFIARKNGFALGMNRDEKLSRVAALPPAIQQLNDRRALFPSEPGGGTWVGVNDAGIGCALINWYAIAARVRRSPVSRGRVVTAALTTQALADTQQALDALPLTRINPFRLLTIFPARRELVEWRWNLKVLVTLRHPWETATWISSGFDEPGAQITRQKNFDDALARQNFDRRGWLRRLHRSHKPERGPYSTCMHRDDAATVSYTEIIVSPTRAVMHYLDGAPCGVGKISIHRFPLNRSN